MAPGVVIYMGLIIYCHRISLKQWVTETNSQIAAKHFPIAWARRFSSATKNFKIANVCQAARRANHGCGCWSCLSRRSYFVFVLHSEPRSECKAVSGNISFLVVSSVMRGVENRDIIRRDWHILVLEKTKQKKQAKVFNKWQHCSHYNLLTNAI